MPDETAAFAAARGLTSVEVAPSGPDMLCITMVHPVRGRRAGCFVVAGRPLASLLAEAHRHLFPTPRRRT